MGRCRGGEYLVQCPKARTRLGAGPPDSYGGLADGEKLYTAFSACLSSMLFPWWCGRDTKCQDSITHTKGNSDNMEILIFFYKYAGVNKVHGSYGKWRGIKQRF